MANLTFTTLIRITDGFGIELSELATRMQERHPFATLVSGSYVVKSLACAWVVTYQMQEPFHQL